MAQSQYDPYAPQGSRPDLATGMGQQALGQMSDAATTARDIARQHPLATLAVAGGLAFAIGALWKLQRPSKTSHVDTLMERLSGLQRQLPKQWRA
jgi:hypothetical protein